MSEREDLPRARDALGMRVPPVAAVRAATRLRNGLDRAHRSSAPPFQLVLERVLGLMDTKALAAAVDLRLPELLAGGPATLEDLASRSGAEPDALGRMLRYLVSRGLFREEAGDRFANNEATEVLREDHPWSWRAWVEFVGSRWHSEIWNHLGERLRGGRSPAEAAFGVPFFEYVNGVNGEAKAAFNSAMACGSRLQGMLFSEHVDLARFHRACDVGGGTGTILAHLLRAHPHLLGTVFDLPPLAEEARTLFDAAGVGERATFAGGSFFESVPGGHDLYTLFAVIHDWDDERCRQILANTRDAMAPGAKVMVVERPLPTDDRPDFARLSDMLMLMLAEGGRERTDAEYAQLFTSVGLALEARITLPSLFVVYRLALA